MLGKRLINTGAVGACTTDTVQILDGGKTQSVALYRFEDNANDTSSSSGKFGIGAIFNGSSSDILVSGLNSMFSTKATFTVSLWFKTTATGNRALFDDYTSNNYKYDKNETKIHRTELISRPNKFKYRGDNHCNLQIILRAQNL